MVKTHHNKAATMTCSIATTNNTQQSISLGCTKKETKRQKMVLTETAMGIMATSMTVKVTGMTVMARIPRLVL
eukprot:3198468-Ditylum_brightwellii.AAC.1